MSETRVIIPNQSILVGSTNSVESIALRQILKDVENVLVDGVLGIFDNIDIYHVKGNKDIALSRYNNGNPEIIVCEGFLSALRTYIAMRTILPRLNDEYGCEMSELFSEATQVCLTGSKNNNFDLPLIEQMATKDELQQINEDTTLATYYLLAHERHHLFDLNKQIGTYNTREEKRQSEFEADEFAVNTIKSDYRKNFFRSYMYFIGALNILDVFDDLDQEKESFASLRIQHILDLLLSQDADPSLDEAISDYASHDIDLHNKTLSVASKAKQHRSHVENKSMNMTIEDAEERLLLFQEILKQ